MRCRRKMQHGKVLVLSWSVDSTSPPPPLAHQLESKICTIAFNAPFCFYLHHIFVFGLTEWVQSLYRLSRHMSDRHTSKNRPKKKLLKKTNKNSLKVHRMGRAKFKSHHSLCDVWLIWCILAHHLKAFCFFLKVVGRRGCEIFGAQHRQ